VGVVLAFIPAYAAINWSIGLNSSSSGNVSNLTISAVVTLSATNVMYPGGNGDVVVKISNPNPYPVTITAVQLPASTVQATGYTSNTLSTPQTGCSGTTSEVVWRYSTSTRDSSHTLMSQLTVGASGAANNPLKVIFTDDASMLSSSPATCENTFFSMPSLTGLTATRGSATPTTSPAIDGWTR
jgi:hypothetical protein